MSEKVISVLAIGGAGCRVMRKIAGDVLAERLRLMAVDTDQDALAESGVPESDRLLAGARWRNGRGCGGNALDGQRAVAHERLQLEKMLSDSRMLLVLGGLGGGTASGGVAVVMSVARKLEIPTVFLLTLPFTLEGHSKRKIAEETVKNELLTIADAVICLPNDLLFSVLEPTTPLQAAFELADREISRTVLALTSVLLHGNLLAADFSDLSMVLRKKKSYCSIGVGIASDGEETGISRGDLAMERLLYSPLLGGADRFSNADAVIFSLLGGPELTIGESRRLLELATRQCGPETNVVVGAATGEEWRTRLLLCAITVKFDAENEVVEVMQKAASRTPRRTREGRANSGVLSGEGAEQLPLPLEQESKGIMEKTTPVYWKNEDLDIPTYSRRKAAIDNGKLVGE